LPIKTDERAWTYPGFRYLVWKTLLPDWPLKQMKHASGLPTADCYGTSVVPHSLEILCVAFAVVEGGIGAGKAVGQESAEKPSGPNQEEESLRPEKLPTRSMVGQAI
jgi:hypothetical protein